MSGKLNCFYCNYSTEMKWNLKRHITNLHPPQKRSADPNKRLLSCKICEFLSPSRPLMIGHYSKDHGINCAPEVFQFKDFHEFELWKHNVETNEMSRFIRCRGARRNNDAVCQTWVCHRDGFCRTRGTGKRHAKRIGSNKINGCCPSQMSVTTLPSGAVVVKFISTHIGHSNDLQRLPFSKRDRNTLAQKIAAGLSFERIIGSLRGSARHNHERLLLVTRQDLANVARDFNLKANSTRHSVYSSIDSWVRTIQDSSNDIRFYKPQGVTLPEFPHLAESDFILVLASDYHLEMLAQHGKLVISFSGTQGTNSCDVEVTSLLTIDDEHNVFPCLFMFSNRNDVVTVSLLTQVVKFALGTELYCDTLISDKTNIFYDGWSNVMPSPNNQLYNSWHVLDEWRKHAVTMICERGKREETCQRLQDLQEEPNESEFPRMLETLIAELKNDLITEEFGNYFANEYQDNCSYWAHCYRKSCAVINQCLESVHKKIKLTYLKSIKTKRLSQAIADLYKITKHPIFETKSSMDADSVTKKLSSIKRQHEKALRMSPTSVIFKIDSSWLVKTEESIDSYNVAINDDTCNCLLICEDCQCCVHFYKCSCKQHPIDWRMCEHIHMVALQNKHTLVALEETQLANNAIRAIRLCETSSNDDCKLVVKDQVSERDNFENRMRKLDDLYNQIKSEFKTISDIEMVQNQLMSILPLIRAERHV